MKNKLIYIMELLVMVLLFVLVWLIRLSAIETLELVNALSTENAMLQQDIAKLQNKVDEQAQEIRDLSERMRVLSSKSSRGGEVDREPQLISLGRYTVTAYCSCEKCCGKYANDRPGGKVYGSAGVELIPGISVAGWLPFGTKIVIDGYEYVVHDRTAAWIRDKYDGKIIDIYFDNHATALDWGKQQLEVWISE